MYGLNWVSAASETTQAWVSGLEAELGMPLDQVRGPGGWALDQVRGWEARCSLCAPLAPLPGACPSWHCRCCCMPKISRVAVVLAPPRVSHPLLTNQPLRPSSHEPPLNRNRTLQLENVNYTQFEQLIEDYNNQFIATYLDT